MFGNRQKNNLKRNSTNLISQEDIKVKDDFQARKYDSDPTSLLKQIKGQNFLAD